MSWDEPLNASRVPDRGVQAERTALAWQRTALVLAATSAAVLRLAAHRAGASAMLACGLVVIVAVVIMRLIHRRYRRSAGAVRRDVERRGSAAPRCPEPGCPRSWP